MVSYYRQDCHMQGKTVYLVYVLLSGSPECPCVRQKHNTPLSWGILPHARQNGLFLFIALARMVTFCKEGDDMLLVWALRARSYKTKAEAWHQGIALHPLQGVFLVYVLLPTDTGHYPSKSVFKKKLDAIMVCPIRSRSVVKMWGDNICIRFN